MPFIASIDDINIVEFEVKQKIQEKFLKSYIDTNLKLKNILIEKNQKVFINFIESTNEYQLFIVDKKFNYFFYQAILDSFKEFEFIDFTLIIYDDFFVIFKDNELYYMQKIKTTIKKEELLVFLNKKLNIEFRNIKDLSESAFFELKKEFLTKQKRLKKLNLQKLNLSKDFSFLIYIVYLFVFITISIFYFRDILNDKIAKQNIDPTIVLKQLEHKSFETVLKKLVEEIEKNSLNLVSFEYKTEFARVIVESKNKESINIFLNSFKKIEQSSIDYQNEKNIFKAVVDVELSK